MLVKNKHTNNNISLDLVLAVDPQEEIKSDGLGLPNEQTIKPKTVLGCATRDQNIGLQTGCTNILLLRSD